jgi:NAD(P)-dependent dehydrogenase (short-subunit alcohol dehydrogenase family)
VPGASDWSGADKTPSGAFPTLAVPRAALVTGGAQRIGQAIALTLADMGYAVAVHYHRSGKAAETTANSIRDSGGKAVALAADLTDEDAVSALLPRAAEALGPIGVLVNNASIFEGDTIDTATRASWDAHAAVNLRAPFVLTQEFARRLPREAGGCIIKL